jgi:hypothetical protein
VPTQTRTGGHQLAAELSQLGHSCVHSGDLAVDQAGKPVLDRSAGAVIPDLGKLPDLTEW